MNYPKKKERQGSARRGSIIYPKTPSDAMEAITPPPPRAKWLGEVAGKLKLKLKPKPKLTLTPTPTLHALHLAYCPV